MTNTTTTAAAELDIFAIMEERQNSEAYNQAHSVAKTCREAARDIADIMKEYVDDEDNWEDDDFLEEGELTHITAGVWLEDGEQYYAVCTGLSDFVGTHLETELDADKVREMSVEKLADHLEYLLQSGFDVDLETGYENAQIDY